MAVRRELLKKLASAGLISATEAVRAVDSDRVPRQPRGARIYQAALQDRLTASWTISPRSVDEWLRTNLRPLRARSREQYANNDYARRFIGMVKANVIGPAGIGMQARVVSRRGNPDNNANDGIEAAWRDWGRRENCDHRRRLSWREMQRVFVATVAMDGEFIAQKMRGPRHNRYGYALQLIDPELLPVEYNRPESNIHMGIEYDADDRPVAYHFTTTARDGSYQWAGRTYRRVEAKDIIHEYVQEYVGQRRGIPWMATALMRLNMLGGFEEAAIVAARAGASKMGFFVSPDGEPPTGDDKDGAGNMITEASPGHFDTVPAGYDFRTYDPAYPSGEFGDFVKACLRGIAAGLEVSYHGLSNDLEGVNFSSIRAGVLEEREVWKGLQEWVIDVFARPVFEGWLNMGLMRNVITTATGARLPYEQIEKYEAVSWQPRRWAWVDPLKDMQASKEAIAANLRSRSDVIRDMGRDPEEVWREMQRETEMMQQFGLTTEPAAKAGSSFQDPDQETEEEPEDGSEDDQE